MQLCFWPGLHTKKNLYFFMRQHDHSKLHLLNVTSIIDKDDPFYYQEPGK